MTDTAQKTEKPTKRRLEKARTDGRFAVSREMVSAVQFLAFVWILFAAGEHFVAAVAAFFRELLAAAFRLQLDSRTVFRLYHEVLKTAITPLLIFGAALAAILLAVQLATTRLGISAGKLTPRLTKLNPLARLRQLLRQNLGSFVQAVLLLPLVGLTLYEIAARSGPILVELPRYAIRPATAIVARSVHDLLWRFAWVLIALGVLDLLRQVHRHTVDLRMSKQEIKEEIKETSGNPQMKSRVRRMQRDLARRNMRRP